MNDNTIDIAQQPDTLDEDALRRRLINRIALAGIAIIALLGGLAVIDSMYVVSPTPIPKVVSAPAIIEAVKPINDATVLAVASAPEKPEPAPEPPQPEAVPSIKSTTTPEETSSPSASPSKSSSALIKPDDTRSAIAKGKPSQELAYQKPVASSTQASPSRPLTQGGGSQAERHFVLQMGVFNNVDNAQELLSKLQKNGVPAQIEARVQVGPFKTKAEADEARSKLKAIGVDAGLLMAIHR